MIKVYIGFSIFLHCEKITENCHCDPFLGMVEDQKYEIASRIECDGYRGTLKYVGPVGSTKGEWLGIDWDDSTRGKHNGTYEGVEYFQAR